jgi:hypothetical protein
MPPPPPGPPPGASPPASPGGASPLGARSPFAGVMTTDQLAQRIIAANPGAQKRPDILVRAMVKAQALLAPEAKADLATLQLQQKVDAANQKFELGNLTLQNKLDLLNQASATKLQIAQLVQAGADRRNTDKLDMALTMLMEKLASSEKQTTDKIEGAQTRTETQVTGREDVAKINADAKEATQGVNQQYRSYAQQTAAINRRVQELFAGGKQMSDLKPEEKTLYDGLVQQRDALAAKAKALGEKAEKAGAGKLRKFSDEVKEAGAAPATPVAPGSTAPAAPPVGGTLPKVTTQQQFDALPSGATYTGSDGGTYRKP